eukprot:1704845-Rhodomonas_salina.2
MSPRLQAEASSLGVARSTPLPPYACPTPYAIAALHLYQAFLGQYAYQPMPTLYLTPYRGLLRPGDSAEVKRLKKLLGIYQVVSAYARAMRYPYWYRVWAPLYAMSGTDLAYGATRTRTRSYHGR